MRDKTCTMGSSSTHHITSNRDNRRLQRSAGGSFKSRLNASQKPVAGIRSPHKAIDRIDFSAQVNKRANEKVAIYVVLLLVLLGLLAYLI